MPGEDADGIVPAPADVQMNGLLLNAWSKAAEDPGTYPKRLSRNVRASCECTGSVAARPANSWSQSDFAGTRQSLKPSPAGVVSYVWMASLTLGPGVAVARGFHFRFAPTAGSQIHIGWFSVP